MTITAVGDGWVYPKRRTNNYVYHRETWIDDLSGGVYNTCRKRKNKRDFPEYPPMRYLPK